MNASSTVSARASSQQRRRRAARDDAALAHEHELVAALRLVHHVGGDEQRAALLRERVEGRPQLAAQDGIEADGRLVEHEQLGVVQQRDGERAARPLAARERADDLVGLPVEPDSGDRRVDAIGRRVEDADEVLEVLAHGQVRVDRRRLGDVGDAPAQLGDPGRAAEHGDLAAGDLLDADDGAHQRRLARAARAEQPGDDAAADGEGDAGEHAPAAADDLEPGDLDHGVGRGRRLAMRFNTSCAEFITY